MTGLHLRTAVALVLVTALGSHGCFLGGTDGEEGNYVFYDGTPASGQVVNFDQELDRPMAVGAALTVAVREGSDRVTPDQAFSSEPGIISVESVDSAGIHLRAHRWGQARITMRKGTTTDTITMRAADIAQTVIHLYPIGELMASVAGLDSNEIVLTPGARIWGFVEQRGQDGEPLTGHGATPCAVSDRGAWVEAGENDRFTLDAPNQEGDLVLSCGQTDLNLPVRSAATAVRLEAYDYLRLLWGPDFQDITLHQNVYLVLIARDAQGRIVQGADGKDVGIETAANLSPYVEDVTDDQTQEIQSTLRDSRGVVVRFATEGAVPIRARWNGLSADLTFQVSRSN